MSAFTAADLKLGGRLQAACDAIGAGHLLRAAGIFNEIADDLNMEATAASMEEAPAEEDWSVPMAPARPVLSISTAPQDLQMCARNVHSYGDPAPVTGWRECRVCGYVNVAPEGGGPVDIGGRQ